MDVGLCSIVPGIPIMNTGSMKRNRMIADTTVHIILTILSIIWLFPVLWIVMESFNTKKGAYSKSFLPEGLTLDNYSDIKVGDTLEVYEEVEVKR